MQKSETCECEALGGYCRECWEFLTGMRDMTLPTRRSITKEN
jgi:hypothetical protein